MFEFIVYLTLSGDVSEAYHQQFATMEECTFRAGSYVAAMVMPDDSSVRGVGSDWMDFDKDGAYEVIVWYLKDTGGDEATVICMLEGTGELMTDER